jgi:hypothetical protein
MSPVALMEKNGFGPNAKSPLVQQEGAYPWREDSLLIWDAILSCTREYLNLYYQNDIKIIKDDCGIMQPPFHS